jgi:hypothetical protein
MGKPFQPSALPTKDALFRIAWLPRPPDLLESCVHPIVRGNAAPYLPLVQDLPLIYEPR